jgi:arginine decarboxylase
MKLMQPDMRPWTVADSAELYQVRAWGQPYFGVNEDGNLILQSPEGAQRKVALVDLIKDIEQRGYSLPVLLRFSDVLDHRVKAIFGSFENAIREYGYKGRYRGVYPIKVNQQRQVVEELVRFGQPLGMGLEAGSKPELLVVLSLLDNPNSLIICNGYKDVEYIETALLAQKLNRTPIIVVDRFEEIEMIIETSKRLGVRPHIGVRARLSTKGAGKWVESTGDRSKFGLSATELVQAVQRLRDVEMLDCLELLHFHIGSQITAIRAHKDALQEATRIFVELSALGASMKYIDCGGGLGVDYDGSQTNFHSSTNYSLQEYANDVVAAIQVACDERDIPHPDIVSESGRALVAHHAVLVFNVLGVNEVVPGGELPAVTDDDHETVRDLAEIFRGITRKNFVEQYHDAVDHKEQAVSLFTLGYLDLAGRSKAERYFWACCDKILKIIREVDYVPDEVAGLQRAMADTFYCNFSVFQSAPDHWAVKQLFPTMPIHRLREKPSRKAVLADITCDSDGKVDQFIDLHDVKDTLELHPFNGQPYYLGMFLVGAYQEILGDLHNLFGDTTAIHVTLDEQHGYRIAEVVEGDSVTEVLGYVQYEKPELLRRLREMTEQALRTGKLELQESALLRKRFEEGLAGYTYLE